MAFLEKSMYESQMKKLATSLLQQRDTMLEVLQQEMSGLAEWNLPEGSYHFWCRLYRQLDERELLDEAIRAGVVFTPGGVYGAEPGWLRLTYSWETKDAIREGIRRLAQVINSISCISFDK